MFRMLGLGSIEIVILCGILAVFVAVAVTILVVVLGSRSKRREVSHDHKDK
ncbi:MAG: hypothetical protein ACI9HK_005073 [Pirellulaceae bacterium]|jgi:hypothetical protein